MWSYIVGFVVGTILGSFIQATASRIMKNQPLKGRSYCLKCQHILGWYDLFPILSYLFLGGKCRYCKKSIPKEDLIVEIVMGIVVALLFFRFLPDLSVFSQLNLDVVLISLSIIFKLFIVVILALLFLIDLKSGYLPDKITLPASIVAAGYLIIITSLKSVIFYQQLAQNPIGKYLLPPHSPYFYNQLTRLWTGVGFNIISGVGTAILFALLIVITRGKGMGWGDVKFVLFLGLALGFPNIIVTVFLAFFLGAAVALFLIAVNKKHFGQTIPFGPFLSAGAFIALLYGQQIVSWYLQLSP